MFYFWNKYSKICNIFLMVFDVFCRGIGSVHVASVEEDTSFAKRVAMMKLKLEQAEIRCASFEPGQYSSMICPKVLFLAIFFSFLFLSCIFLFKMCSCIAYMSNWTKLIIYSC